MNDLINHPKFEPERFCLICETKHNQGQPKYAIIRLPPSYVQTLLTRHRWLSQLKKTDNELAYLAYKDEYVTYYFESPHDIGPTAMLDLHATCSVDLDKMELYKSSFTHLPNYTPAACMPGIKDRYVNVDAAGVYWSGAMEKSADRYGTQTLPIKELTEWLKAVQRRKPAK